MNSSTCKERVSVALVLCGFAITLALSLCADTHTDGSLTNITETSRTDKNGSGTLVLSGNN